MCSKAASQADKNSDPSPPLRESYQAAASSISSAASADNLMRMRSSLANPGRQFIPVDKRFRIREIAASTALKLRDVFGRRLQAVRISAKALPYLLD